MRPNRLMAAVLGLAVLGGCASSPQPTFYTLTSARAQERTQADVPAAIAIGPVAVPEMVDRPQLVLRVSATQVRLDEFARWAEPLKRQIPACSARTWPSSSRGRSCPVIRSGPIPGRHTWCRSTSRSSTRPPATRPSSR